MPIKESAKKALRQNVKKQAQNVSYESKIKSLVKEVRALVAQKKIKEAKNLLPEIFQALDKATKVNTIKFNTASRKKSRLAKLIAKNS